MGRSLVINGEVVSIILKESQEMKKSIFIKENPGEKVIGMQIIHQQGPGSKFLLDAWVGTVSLPHLCFVFAQTHFFSFFFFLVEV